MRFQIYINEHAGQSPKGGMIGINDYFYKGGQFLPSTKAEPGKWKIGKKWVTTKKEQVEPNKFEVQPTPLSRSLFSLLGVGQLTVMDGKKIKINDGVRASNGEEVTPKMKMRPGVKGILGKHEFTLQDLVDQYNKGARWIEIEPQKEITVIKHEKKGNK
jgi:hypothetical protein